MAESVGDRLALLRAHAARNHVTRPQTGCPACERFVFRKLEDDALFFGEARAVLAQLREEGSPSSSPHRRGTG